MTQEEIGKTYGFPELGSMDGNTVKERLILFYYIGINTLIGWLFNYFKLIVFIPIGLLFIISNNKFLRVFLLIDADDIRKDILMYADRTKESGYKKQQAKS